MAQSRHSYPATASLAKEEGVRAPSRTHRAISIRALGIAFLLAGLAAASADPSPAFAAETQSQPAARRKSPPKPTLQQLLRKLEEQQTMIEAQQAIIDEQQAKIDEQQAKLAQQDADIQAQQTKLTELEQQLAAMKTHLEEMQMALPSEEERKALEERLKQIQEEAEKVPELPPNVVSAGEFPGSIKIPNTDAAVKFGGRIRMAAVFTLDPLGSSDRFVTNTIPVDPSDEAAGEGKRTTFTANTSRFNFELRTPTGVGYMRAFIEGDFYGTDANGSRTNFRLRHAFAQFRGFLVGQTWSTVSDPAADHQDLDFEGINSENVIRQAQIRYTWNVRETFSVAAAAETPEVSLTGGEGENIVPDLIGRTIWQFKDIGHLQTAVVLRQIRGTPDVGTTGASSAFAYGVSLSGVVPFYYFNLTDRFIFQLTAGKGIARYINDMQSLGGQDGVFDPVSGELMALPAKGFYLDYEHQWKEWETTRNMALRSSLIWSFVTVDNFDFQLPSAYHRTNRFSFNLVFSPIKRIDVGLEYINGTRENKDGHEGRASQIQAVSIFRF